MRHMKISRLQRRLKLLLPAMTFIFILFTNNAVYAEGNMIVQSAAEVGYPPFSIVDEAGQATGFAVELMREVLAVMHYDVTFQTDTWAEVRALLEQGKIQALPLVGRTPEREDRFDFSFAYMTLHGAIVVRNDMTDVRSFDDLAGRQVAVMKDDNAEEFLRREERNFTIHCTPTFEDSLHGLSDGQFDAVVIPRLVALRLLRKTGLTNLRIVETPIEEFYQDFCFAVREGDRETLAVLNEGLSIVIADGTYRRLHKKWFAAYQIPVERTIIVGGDRNFPPFEYIDSNGRPAGFVVDITRAIARELNMDIQIQLGNWSERLESLSNGKIDVIQGIFYSPDRDDTLDFSQPYTALNYVSATRKGSNPPPESFEELAGRHIMIQKDDLIAEYLQKYGLIDHVSFAEDQTQVLEAVAEGRVDCGLVIRINALHVIRQHGWDNIVLGKHSFVPGEYCYAVSHGQKELLANFSEGLRLIEESGELHRISDKWLGIYAENHEHLRDFIKYSVMVLVPLLLGFIFIALWSWSLRREVRNKTKELVESMETFKFVFESVNVAKSMTALSGEVNVNQAFADFLGHSREELEGRTWQSITPPDEIEAIQEKIAPLLSGEEDFARFKKRYIHKDGHYLWADVSVTIRRDVQGNPLYFVTSIVDINEQIQAEEALKKSEESLRAMLACSPLALFHLDLEGRVKSWNRTAEKIFRWTEEEVIDKYLPIVPADKQEEFEELRNQVSKGEQFVGRELQRQRKDGSPVMIRLSVAPLYDGDGTVIGIMSAVEDITKQKQIEQLLRESESRYQTYVEHAPVGIFITNIDMQYVEVNRAACTMTGYSKAELLNMRITDLSSPQSSEGEVKTFTHLTETGELQSQVSIRKKDGTDIIISLKAVSLPNNCYMAFCTDITDQIHSELQFSMLFNEMPIGVAILEGVNDGADFIFKALNRAGEKINRIQPGKSVGKSIKSVFPNIEKTELMAALRRVWNSGCLENLPVTRYEDDRISGWRRHIIYHLPGDEIVVLFEDMTELVRAEKEKEILQNQLLQSQKMESIGRLAGGTAHDFNNLLTAIQGYSEHIEDSLPENDPLREDIAIIQRAVSSAASLTNQLLAFSRKQLLSPKVVNLNDTIISLEKMLKRIIGEDIELVFKPDRELHSVFVDPGQIDQIIINLAVNSRDAMPRGGKLTIETLNVSLDEKHCQTCPEEIIGDYVMLAVSDNGEGIEQEKLVNIFEPFFTTKERDKGTGLGLSTVHGIVHQSKGHVNVYSEIGKGTTFKLYFPVESNPPEKIGSEQKLDRENYYGNETIMIVEDQEMVLQLAVSTLKKYNYRVFSALDVDDAVKIMVEQHDKIQLLITDVIMPKMSGKQLFKKLQRINPQLRVIYMSGYTENVIAHHGILDKGINFLPKPFRTEDLLRIVRLVLNNKSDKTQALIVDDEEMMRELLGLHLRRLNFEVLDAADGTTAFSLFLSHKTQLKLIILDLSLPDITGESLFYKIRDSGWNGPIIFASGYTTEDIAEIMENEKNVFFLEKPFLKKDIKEMVRGIFHQSTQAR